MPQIPPIPIDDAFFGMCLQKIGLSGKIHNNRAFKERDENTIE